MTWKSGEPHAIESTKCRWDIVPWTRGVGLEIGSGFGKAFPHFTGVDSLRDAKLFGANITADVVCESTNMPQFATGGMDFVFSSHTLEHIQDHVASLKEWWRVVKVGGHLVLYLPHADFYPRMGSDGANPDHKHDFLPDDISSVMKDIGAWDLMVNEERDEKDEYSFLQVYRKMESGHAESWRTQKPAKTCAVVRYGAWGDGLQTASIFPGLKAQGYHLTLYTTPRCNEVLLHDPHVDRVILQDEEQVPNAWLSDYWTHLRTKYDKFINLSESVEANFLEMPSRIRYHWPKAARHAVMNHNYGEMLHRIAEVPYDKPQSTFYASESEKRWAMGEREAMHANPIILWVLAGSAIHKVWPHVDDAVENILEQYPDARIVTVGDDRCRDMLEKPWVDEPRIIRRSGVWGIRQTLAFAQCCDMVIGPETGVLNSVAMSPMAKIVLLSHSTHENLTRDWVNTYPLSSEKTHCYPCHKMIHTWDQCNQDKSGLAACMTDISADRVFNVIKMALPMQVAAA